METSMFLRTMHRRLIKNFSDIFILSELRKGPLSGYDVIEYINNRFRILLSSGTVYAILYSLERDGLITGNWTQRRRTYTLTPEGRTHAEGNSQHKRQHRKRTSQPAQTTKKELRSAWFVKKAKTWFQTTSASAYRRHP